MLYKHSSQYGWPIFPASLFISQPADITDTDYFTISIYGIWVGTIQFEGSLDKTNWFPITMQNLNGTVAASTSVTSTGSDVNGGYTKVVGHGLLYFRINMSAYTSGTAGIAITGNRQGRS